MSGHADQRADQAVKDAVEAGEGACVLRNLCGTCGKHPLPDVLADQDAKEVNHEVGDDRVPADLGEAEVRRGQLGHQFVPAADAVQADWQQDKHQADGLDHELHDVSQGQRPHAADGRVHHHHATAQQHRDPERQAEQHLQHGADGEDRGPADQQRVGEHEHRTGLAGHGVVALFQDMGHGEDVQFQQRLGQEQVQRNDPRTQCGAQREPGNAMHITQAHGADGGRSAQHGGSHGAHVQRRAEVAAGYQVVFMGLGAAHAVVAEHEHAGGVDEYDE